MKHPIILVTSSTAEIGAEFPDPSVSVAHNYLDAIRAGGGIPLCLPIMPDADLVSGALDCCDGILLTGGGDINPTLYWPEVPGTLLATCEFGSPGRDEMEFMLIRSALDRRVPILAICRGHQLVNVALGGTLYVDLPTQRPGEVLHCDYDRRFEAIHDIHLAPDSRFARLAEREILGVNSTHHQAIERLASVLRVAAAAPDGVIEATEFTPEEQARRGWLQTVQYHPERLLRNHPEHRFLFDAFLEACKTR